MPDQVIHYVLRFRGDAFNRLESYIIYYLDKEWARSEDLIKNIFGSIINYIKLLNQSFGDLDAVRTAELRLLKLKQKGSISDYLTRFTQYSA
jgi:hypothetical protein